MASYNFDYQDHRSVPILAGTEIKFTHNIYLAKSRFMNCLSTNFLIFRDSITIGRLFILRLLEEMNMAGYEPCINSCLSR